MLNRTLQFHAQAFDRPLDWRWRLAGRVLGEGGRPPRGDPALAAAVGYRRTIDRVGFGDHVRRVSRSWPGLDVAHRLSIGPGPVRGEVEALVLAGQPDDAIAARCGLSAAAVGYYEQVFFQVRDRLSAPDWVTTRVLGAGAAGAGRALTTVAYYGGVLAYDVMRAALAGGPLPGPVAAALGARPAFAEARLRLACQLLASALQARSAEELAALIGVYERAAGLDRGVTGRPDALRSRLGVARRVLELAVTAGRPQRLGPAAGAGAVRGLRGVPEIPSRAAGVSAPEEGCHAAQEIPVEA